MDIGEAIEAMKKGKFVARENWDGRSLAILEPGANAKMTRPYIYRDDGDGARVPWCASHAELLATDWKTVDHAE